MNLLYKQFLTNTLSTLWVWNTFSLKNYRREKQAFRLSLEIELCEPSVPPLEHLLDSVLKTYYKLHELGIKEIDGKITIVEDDTNNDVK